MDCFYSKKEFFVQHSKELVTFKSERGKFLYPNNFEWKHPDIILKQMITQCCLGWESKKRLSASELLKHPYFTCEDSDESDSDTDE